MTTANTTNKVRLDIRTHWIWEWEDNKHFFWFKGFDPKSCRCFYKSLQQCDEINKQAMKRAYNNKILQIEQCHGLLY